MKKLVVVDCFNSCQCHTVVTLRCPDQQRWVFIRVRNPSREINFGDFVYAHADPEGPFSTDEFWLDRGPRLYRELLIKETFPVECSGI